MSRASDDGRVPARDRRRPSLDGPSVVAFTTEDDHHAEVRHAAGVHAKAHGCSLILYAADVASLWSEPMPNQWASEGEAERFGDRLSPKDLELLGRSAIARQVRESRRVGAKASASLPKDKGIEALAAYAAAQGAHIVFVPESMAAIDELRPLLAGAGGGKEAPRVAVELQVVVRLPDSTRHVSESGDPAADPT
ncbi:MAG: hypothetical protein IVW53_11285 [Chloroflexi bacterium]|nr:hypothetical protein [Chloroflexota bacterium]